MLFLGVESALHATKVVVVDLESATVVSEEEMEHVFEQGLPQGHLEQDPAYWIKGLDYTVRACLERLGPRRDEVVAMSVGAQPKGMVLLDSENQIIRPAKVAGDVSAQKQLDRLNREFGGPPGLGEILGNSIQLDSPAAHLLWLKEEKPDQFQNAVSIMQPLSLLNFWLTGERAAEVGDASQTGMLDVRRGEWSSLLCDFIDPGLEHSLLPLRNESALLGPLRMEVAQSWGIQREILVSRGSGLAMMAALGSGSSHANTAVVSLLNTGAVWGAVENPLIDPRGEIAAWCHATPQWLAYYEEESAEATLRMIDSHYQWSPSELEKMASRSEVGSQGLKALLLGSGRHRSGFEGMFYGMTAQNFQPKHVARAILEGVAGSLGYGYQRMEELGQKFNKVCVTGRGSGSALWRQMVSDVCGVPCYRLCEDHGAAMGAAIHAAAAYFQHTGEKVTFTEIASRVVTAEESSWIEPDAKRHEFYLDQLSRQQYLAEKLIGTGFLM
jgi:xylulokinase